MAPQRTDRFTSTTTTRTERTTAVNNLQQLRYQVTRAQSAAQKLPQAIADLQIAQSAAASPIMFSTTTSANVVY